MRAGFRIALIAFVAAALFPTARADNAAVRKALDKQYAAFDRALRRKDARAIEAMATPDFTMTEEGRTMKAAEAMTALKQQMAMTREIKKDTWRFDKLDVRGKQAVAVVTGQVIATVTMPDRKEHLLNMTATSRDTWVNTNGGWKMKSTTVLHQKTLMDGKPLNPATMMSAPPPAGPHGQHKRAR